jgi:T-complex protein 1 subunit delta
VSCRTTSGTRTTCGGATSSLPKIQSGNGEVVITNDGATILRQMSVSHPTAKMMVELSKSQDIEAGDGTTSVVVMAGGLLNSCNQLLSRGIHPNQISDSFSLACRKATDVMRDISVPIDFNDRDTLIKCTTTSLSSKGGQEAGRYCR